jgi:hypothetical protein
MVLESPSQAKLAVRTQTHKLKSVVVWLAIDEHQVGPESARSSTADMASATQSGTRLSMTAKRENSHSAMSSKVNAQS